MTRYRLRPAASRDVDGIADYLYENASRDVAYQFLAEAEQAFALLADQPEIGWLTKEKSPLLEGARTFRVSSRFREYMIFYRRWRDGIEVIRILHGARDLEGLFD